MLGYSRQSWTRLLREGTWVVLGQASTALAGLVGVRLLTELAPRRVFGEVSLLLGILAIGKNMFVSPVINYQVRYHSEYLARGRAQEFTRRILRLCWHGTAWFLLAGTIAYLARWLLIPQPFRPWLLVVLAALVCLDTIKSVEATQLQAERQQGRLAAWLTVEMWLTMAMTVLGLWLLPTPEMYLAATALAVVTGIVLFYPRSKPGDIASRSADNLETEAELTRRVLSYGLPFVPLALSCWVTNVGDRYILGGMKGYAEVGLYAAAYGIASRPMLAAGSVLATVVRPILFQTESEQRFSAARRTFLLWLGAAVAISVAAVAGLSIFGKWIAGLLLAPDYRQGAPAIMTWVGLGYGLNNVVAVLEARVLAHGISRSLLLPGVVCAGANLALNFVLIPRLGALGAAQATAGAFATQLLLLILVLGLRNGVETEPAMPEPAVVDKA